MQIQTYLLRALVGAAFTVIPASAAGITLTVNPLQPSAGVGGTSQIDLMIGGLGNKTAPSLSAFDIDLTFDPALLSVSKTVFGTSSPTANQLALSGSVSITQVGQSTPGDLRLQEISLDSPSVLDTQQLGAFTVAEITLRGEAPGVSPLSLSVNALGDSQGDPLSASRVTGASLTVTPSTATPEPKSLALLGIGLLALLCAKLRIGFSAT